MRVPVPAAVLKSTYQEKLRTPWLCAVYRKSGANCEGERIVDCGDPAGGVKLALQRSPGVTDAMTLTAAPARTGLVMDVISARGLGVGVGWDVVFAPPHAATLSARMADTAILDKFDSLSLTSESIP